MSDDKKVDPPRPSPVADYSNAFSPLEAEENSKVRTLDKLDLWTKLQWTALGAIVLTIASSFVWGLNTLNLLNSAQAQDKVTVTADHEELKRHLDKDAAEKVVIFQMFEEQRKDNVAIYNAVMTKKKQARLEHRDGGDE